MSKKTNASTRLLHLKEKIILEWEKIVRNSTASTGKLDRPQLLNSLPEVLNLMVKTLTDPNPDQALYSKEKMLAANHGKTRASLPDYSLEQVINEYHILRRVLFDILEEGGQDLTRAERDLIWDVIFISIKNAAAEFQQVRDEQKEEVQRNLNQANVNLKEALGEKSSETVINDQLLKTIYERVEDYAIFTLDPNGLITSWAIGCQRIKQYKAEDVMGKNYSMLYPREGQLRNEPQKHLDIARSEGRFRGEGTRQRKNGELFLADVFITPMYDQDELVGFFKIVTDLSERNKLIQERDLSRMQVETLEVESVLRDRFIYMLTHDLRNPLQAARMSAEMITRQTCNIEKHLDFARRSIQHVSRLDNMITNLLDASRIKEGEGFPITIQECDLSMIVHEVQDELTTLHGDRFEVNTPSEFVGFWDGKNLRRAIENLATNAIKYGAPDQKVCIRVSEVENRAIIKVQNFGSLISTKDQESLFNLFQRTVSAEKGATKGWGIGLTLVKGITEAHKGVVKVRSIPSEGTTFTLDLPRDART